MVTTTRVQKRHDHRLRELVRTTRDMRFALQHGVPRSTARGWLTGATFDVVCQDVLNMDVANLQYEVIRLRTRVQKQIALVRILLAVLKVSKFSLNHGRLPDGKDKRLLLRAIERVLKHKWLYLNSLDTVATVRKLVAFYVEQHNSELPHSAFHGRTPAEIYFRTGDDIPKRLEAARQKARQARADPNRQRDCEASRLPAASLN